MKRTWLVLLLSLIFTQVAIAIEEPQITEKKAYKDI